MAPPVHLIFGNDEYVVSTLAREYVRKLVPPEEEALGLEIVDGAAVTVEEARLALKKCIEAVSTLGFFGNRKVIWFRDVNFLSDTVVGKSQTVKELVTALAGLIQEGLPPGQVLVVSSPKVDKRYAFYKACKSRGTLEEHSVSEKAYAAEREAAERLRGMLKKAKLQMDGSTQQVFLSRVGTDTRQLVNEVQKLAIFVGPGGGVGMKDVEAVTCSSREAAAWDLADALGNRDLPGALRIVRQLLFQKENPIRLIMGIQGRLRELMIYRDGLERGWLTESGMGRRRSLQWGAVPPDIEVLFTEAYLRDPRATHPFRVGLLAGQAGKFTPDQLRQAYDMAVAAHEELVSSSMAPQMVLEMLLLRLLA
jgi:DNA polymerase-3 subunit delta